VWKKSNQMNIENNKQKMVLVTGATGFVGKPLVEKLFSMNYRVRTISRNKKQLEGVFNEGVEIMQCDISNNEELERALTGVDIAYYLVHSMEGKSSQWEDFAEKDRQIAKNFANVSKKCKVKRIIYLGGLAHGTDSEMSEHMRSRKDVGKILSKSGIPVTIFRASVILGKGGGGFEMMHYLVERLPLMICPKWVLTKLQPISLHDTLEYLVKSIDVSETENKILDIGGPDVLTYVEMMKVYGDSIGKKVRVIIIPFLSLRLTSVWVDLVTPVKSSLARPLVEGLKNESTVTDNEIKKIIPLKLKGVEESIELSKDDSRETKIHRNDKLLIGLLLSLAIIGYTQFVLDVRIGVFNFMWLVVMIAWSLLLAVSIYFTVKDARIGPLIGAVGSWITVSFWLIDNAYLISNLQQIGGYKIGQAFELLGSYPSTTITMLNLMGIVVCASLAVVTHFSFYRERS